MRFPANEFTARSSLLDFDLSRIESLRTLEVIAQSIISWNDAVRGPKPAIPRFLRTILRTITSPVFSEVVVIYREHDFSGLWLWPSRAHCVPITIGGSSRPEGLFVQDLRHRRLFEAFREMYRVRDFLLVLRVEVRDGLGGFLGRVLMRAVAAEDRMGLSDRLPDLIVVSSPRGPWNIKDLEEGLGGHLSPC